MAVKAMLKNSYLLGHLSGGGKVLTACFSMDLSAIRSFSLCFVGTRSPPANARFAFFEAQETLAQDVS